MSMDRRQMLSTAVLGSAAGIVGATTLGSVAPEEAFADEVEDSGAEPGGVDPNYAEGIVTSINGTNVLLERGDGVMGRVFVAPGTSIWKLRPTGFDKVEVGDHVSARGVAMPDGALAADAVWVNIVNFMAHIVSISRNTIHLEHDGFKAVGHVVPGTTVASYNSTPAVSDLSPLKVGDHIQVLGAQHPGSDHVEIATVFAVV